MLQHSLSRTELLIGKDALDKLAKSKVMVFGVGGVGSFTVEALARAGVGNLILVDDDTVCLTNLNRQIHATYKTISKNKVEVMKERVLSVNRNCNVNGHIGIGIFINAPTAIRAAKIPQSILFFTLLFIRSLLL